MFRTALVVMLAAALIVSLGCRRASESVAEKMVAHAIEKEGGGKADVNLHDGKIDIKTKDGEMSMTAGGGAKIPEDFPKDVLVVKNAKILAAIKVPDGFSLSMESKDSVEKLMDQYTAEMKAQGWTTETTMNMGEQMVTSFAKDKRKAAVMIAKGGEGSQLTITVTQEKGSAQ